MISYRSKKVGNEFLYVGNEPLRDEVCIPMEEIEDKVSLLLILQKIDLKIRPKSNSTYGDIVLTNPSAAVSKGSRRTKERKIG
jgi:hypothetical protein